MNERLDPEVLEWTKCSKSPAYFVHNYCWIYDNETSDWIRFRLWKEQYQVIKLIHANQFVIILKARQLGLTWLNLGYALWLMLFRAIATVLLFSKRDDEARYLLGDERLRGMYARLPDWMKAKNIITDNEHLLELSNGSTARAFPTSAGDSYTATFALVDEADLVPDLGTMLRSVKPTIADGGQMVLLSRADKRQPNSLFKRTYKAAKLGLNEWVSVFLPWHVRPGRDVAWYAAMVKDTQQNTGGLDDVYEQYPATDEEALAPAQLDKRIPQTWLRRCYEEERPIPADALPPDTPDIPDLKVFRPPVPGERYVVGMDCAEGLPTSDDSATDVVEVTRGEQVAKFAGKYTPEAHAAMSAKLAHWYNDAPLMPENNNHGWSAILWLKDNTRLEILEGHNRKDGWSSTTLGKVILYDTMAESAKHSEVIIHDFVTYTQLQSIEKATLRAPERELEDQADSFALANVARSAPVERTVYDDSQRVEIGW